MENNQLAKLNELLGSYKAEWLSDKIFAFFTEPDYFVSLKGNRPCVLQGGRGTGKTTVLRGLSYEGQFELHDNDIDKFDQLDFIGIYYRADTNHAWAFSGGSIADDEWGKFFGHYFNIVICKEIIKFVNWHKTKRSKDQNLTATQCRLIAKSLHIEEDVSDSMTLQHAIEMKMLDLQGSINNIDPDNPPKLTIQGVPIQIITENVIALSQFNKKIFYILIDEYENLKDEQQRILNTLLKHNTKYYTFKIGVRELGLRVKYTLNENELLNDPADYTLINIEKKLTEEYDFSDFAKKVCLPRIEQLISKDITNQSISIEEAFPSLDMEEEAIHLKVEDSEFLKSYSKISPQEQKMVDGITLLYKFFIAYWAKTHNLSLAETIRDYDANKSKWDERYYDNYRYSMLFKIRKGRGKGGIQKFYVGWSTYVKLANGNIRYLMELVYRAYEKHIVGNNSILSPISYKDQTLAAQEVGEKNLMELEGLWNHGAQLTKILLGFGRIFNVMACDDETKLAPEINQFSIIPPVSSDCTTVVNAAVMNLALIRMSGTKPGADYSTKEAIYMIHPIFAPFFEFSFRKKRKMDISEEDLMGVISDHKQYIKKILKKKKITLNDSFELPEQLNLFTEYYNDKSGL